MKIIVVAIAVLLVLAGCGGSDHAEYTKPPTVAQIKIKAEHLLDRYYAEAGEFANRAEAANRAGHLAVAEVSIRAAERAQSMYGFLNQAVEEPRVALSICVSAESKEKASHDPELMRYWRALCAKSG